MLKELQSEYVAAAKDELPRLEAGDHLDQPTFHRLYEAMLPGFRAELIEGVVIVPSPLHRGHGRHQRLISGWLSGYEAATPGVEGFGNISTILSSDSEPQPDETLVIAPDRGGQTKPGDDDEPLKGAPELIVEVASSSVAYDLHTKYRMYERVGVREYVVVVLREKRVRWFVSDGKEFNELAAGQDGIFRCAVFPGLWLDAEALFRKDPRRLLETLDLGLVSPEHAVFVEQLKSRRKG